MAGDCDSSPPAAVSGVMGHVPDICPTSGWPYALSAALEHQPSTVNLAIGCPYKGWPMSVIQVTKDKWQQAEEQEDDAVGGGYGTEPGDWLQAPLAGQPYIPLEPLVMFAGVLASRKGLLWNFSAHWRNMKNVPLAGSMIAGRRVLIAQQVLLLKMACCWFQMTFSAQAHWLLPSSEYMVLRGPPKWQE